MKKQCLLEKTSGNAFFISDFLHFLSFCFNSVSENSYKYSKASEFAYRSETLPCQHESP